MIAYLVLFAIATLVNVLFLHFNTLYFSAACAIGCVLLSLFIDLVLRLFGYHKIPGNSTLFLGETEKNPCNVLSWCICSKLSLEKLQKNWMDNVYFNDKFSRLRCKVVHIPLLGDYFLKTTQPVGDNLFLSPQNDEVVTKADFERICAVRASQPLARDKPLFEVELFTKFNDEHEEGDSIIMMRSQHVLADGIGLLTIIAAQIGENTDEILMQPKRKTRRIPRVILYLITIATMWFGIVPKIFRRKDKNPFHDSSITPSGVRRCAVSTGIPLQKIKTIRKAFDPVTLNDVVVGCLCGAFRRYFIDDLTEKNGGKLDDKELERLLPRKVSANVPINMRSQLEDCQPKFENKFTFLLVGLPIFPKTAVDRLMAVHKMVMKLKKSTEPISNYFVVNHAVMSWLPRWLADLIITFMGNKPTCLLTNVPGAQAEKKFEIDGCTLHSVMFYVPQRGECCLGVSIITMHGSLRIGVLVDEAFCKEPYKLIKSFEDEIEELSESAKSTQSVMELV
eukprot:TRINITY_DN464_c0_g1_i2.p1 TRINITY_DN464_c0_g1~~TRINITY_DN464_c0_g1_i2.p1  ORF type:complete len:507 (+),score=95.34 TRINITY_DN464_c0_g1_i2:86-1606(+)